MESISALNKLQKKELNKLRDSRKIIIEDIKATDSDDNENPAAYITNDLSVYRAIRNSISILKYLQLMCENHNFASQNMIREQCNEDGSVKLTSVDFITYLAWSLEGFLTMMNDQTFDVCGAVVDTVTEAIQGPCKGNQLALVQNKIIDTAREIISGFEREQELVFLNFVTDDDIDAIGEFKGNVI